MNLLSLTAGDVSGDVPNFAETMNTWTILTTTTGITGFDASFWTVDDTGFDSVPSASGTWTVTQSGNNLMLSYVAVPEPISLAILASGAVAVGVLRRHRK